jgi:hypothetical protein
MGHESLIYGVIVGTMWKLPDSSQMLQELNRQVIESLPETDEWPFLTRAMFAIAGDDVRTGTYKSQPIHFGATLKGLEWEWHEWLPKFEAVLQRLYWDETYLHLRTEGTVGYYDYVYRTEYDPTFHKQELPQPLTTWTLSGGPRRFFNGLDILPLGATEWRYEHGVWHSVASGE